jgi:two-component system OmpR family sensor kinase
MFQTLYSKLAAVILILFTLVGIFVVIVVIYATDMYRQEVSQKLNRDLAENLVKERLLIKDNKINHEALDDVFHMLMVINPSIELYLLDPEGNILDYSAAPHKIKRKRVSLAPIKTWLSGEGNIPLQGDDPRHLSRQKVFSAARIPPQGELSGYLYVILGGEEYDTIVQMIQGSFILKLSSWMIVAGLFFTVITGLIIFALLTGRLKKLAAGMNAFKSGESLTSVDLLPAKLPAFLSDEVDHLSQTFREMAGRIDEQMGKLQKSDLMRRELVANVSHDLRTPLATLTAYIETMQLKEADLSADEWRKYLKVAHKHCQRLSSLVDDLFELARLEAKETKLNLEPFSIAELVQDVVQNYDLTAKEKGVTLTSNIGQKLSFVRGDIGLVERVLENLIMNAIRHTPQGGTVSIILIPSNDNMKVQVLDTGVGIPEEALPHIFDRFYKFNAPETLPASFSGLGLAIAKRIMDLHGSAIEVESELNSGTCFTFRLPVHSSL